MASWVDKFRKKESKKVAKKRKREGRRLKAESERVKKEKERQIRALILEVSFYLAFLILLVCTAVNNRDPKAFGYSQSTRNVIDANNTVGKVRTVDQFWHWLENTLLPFLYPTRRWNNSVLTSNDDGIVSTFASHRVGPLRIRQHRIRDEECSLESYFRDTNIRCVYSWSNSLMDDRYYNLSWNKAIQDLPERSHTSAMSWTAWYYRSWSDIGGTPLVGVYEVYPSGGYVMDSVGDLTQARNDIGTLKNSTWVDEMTRLVSVEFTLFSPGANLFNMALVVFEFPQADLVMGNVHLYVFRLFSYVGGYPLAKQICDTLVYTSIVLFMWREIYKIWEERLQYFKQFWNILELVNLILSIVAITLYIGRHIITTYVSSDIFKKEDQFYNFQTLAMWNELFAVLLGFVCFLSTLQLLHLLRYNRRMSLLAATLKEARKDLSAFFLVFVLVFMAFVSLCYFTFGSNLLRYSSVIRSIQTLVTVALGDFDYYALTYVNFVLAKLFLFAYMMFIVFLLINMLITILNDAFAVVRSDASKQPNDFELVDYIVVRVVSFLWTLNPVRVIWGTAKDAGIVDTDAPKNAKDLSADGWPLFKRRASYQPRQRHRKTFNTDLVRLHNRLDALHLLVDHFTGTLQDETKVLGTFNQKRVVNFSEVPFEEFDILSLSFDESEDSAEEQVVPGILKIRHDSHGKADTDESVGVVPDNRGETDPNVDTSSGRSSLVLRVETGDFGGYDLTPPRYPITPDVEIDNGFVKTNLHDFHSKSPNEMRKVNDGSGDVGVEDNTSVMLEMNSGSAYGHPSPNNSITRRSTSPNNSSTTLNYIPPNLNNSTTTHAYASPNNSTNTLRYISPNSGRSQEYNSPNRTYGSQEGINNNSSSSALGYTSSPQDEVIIDVDKQDSTV